MANPPKSGLDPIKIFLHAGAFHKSYTLLCDSVVPDEEWALPDDQRVGVISHPAMVLSVFASELYLLCVETGSVPAEHNLKKLFDGLQIPTKRELDDLWDADIRHPSKQQTIEHVRAALIGHERRLAADVSDDQRAQRLAGHVGDAEGNRFAAAPDKSEDGHLAHAPYVALVALADVFVLFLAADVRLVRFDDLAVAAKRTRFRGRP